ncbi:MAG: outer membrane beta-barrel protein [Bradymonadia bacterium]
MNLPYRTLSCVWTTLMLLVALSTATNAQGRKKIAVLEFINTAGLTEPEAKYVPDLVRGEATRLPQGGYLIMTRENILEMLPPGVDLASCEGSCEVETGRNVGADFVVSGQIIKFGSKLKVTMKLYETGNGALLASERASAADVDTLEEPVVQAARRMFSQLAQKATVAPAPEPKVEPKPEPTPEPKPEPVTEPNPEPATEPEPKPAVSQSNRRAGGPALLVGVTAASLSTDSDLEEYDSKSGLALYARLQTPLGESLDMILDLGYVQKGSTFTIDGFSGEGSVSLNYFESTVGFRYNFGDFEFNPFVVGGVFTGILTSASGEFDGSELSDVEESFSGFDAGWLVGGGVDFGALTLELRVTQGVLDINDNIDSDAVVNTSTGMLLVGYLLGQ